MPRPRMPYVQKQVTQHGKVVWYFRRGSGQRVRLWAAYGSPEFVREYQAALQDRSIEPQPKANGGTLSWLIRQYMQSSAWQSLAAGTRAQRGGLLRNVEKQAGDVPFTAITRQKIIKGREDRAGAPNQANNFIKTMRGLWRFALDDGHVDVDPTANVKIIATKSDGFHVWSDDEIARYEARWPIGTRERLALDLLLWTGLRRGDAVRLGRQHVRNGVFKIKTEKNGVIVEAPILPALARSIAAAPTGDLAFIVGDKGGPLSKKFFGNWFHEACKAAGVPGSAHELRKAGATRAAENGATTTELKAIFGWTNDTMPAHYTKTADRARSAAGAMAKLERKEHDLSPHLESEGISPSNINGLS